MWSNYVKRFIKTNRFLFYPIKKYREYMFNKRAKILQNVGFKLNEEIYSALKNIKIEYYVGFGTLLGVVRDNSFIKHDDDIDYFVNIHDSNDWLLIFNILTSKGYTPKGFYIENNQIHELGFEKNGIRVDFFQLYKSGNSQSVDSYYRNPNLIYKANVVSIRKYNFEVIPGHFVKIIKGSHFTIPNNYENILKAIYGDNWRTPIKNCKESKYTLYLKDAFAKRYIISKKI